MNEFFTQGVIVALHRTTFALDKNLENDEF